MSTRIGSDEEAGDVGDATLDRATAALREAAVPAGPSPLVRERTLAALASGSRGSSAAHPFGPPWRRASPGNLGRVAAVLVLGAGAVAAYVGLSGRGFPYAAPARPTTPAVATGPDTRTAVRPPGNGPGLASAAPGSMVTGEIRYDGDAPAPQLINFGANAGCAATHAGPMYDDSLLVNLDNSLRNVVVSVVAGLPEGKRFAGPGVPVYLDQKGCFYQPHVLAMMTGQKVLVRNSDPTLHNTHSLAMKNPSFNIAQPQSDPGSTVPSPDAPEFFQVRCDIHPWMVSWFCVFNHPYFDVSGANGTFTLRDLPPGRYRLRAWHEKLGVQERDIVVKPGATRP